MQLKLSGSQLQTFRLHSDFMTSLQSRTLLHGLRVFVHELKDNYFSKRMF